MYVTDAFNSGVARCAEEKQRALVAGAESGIPVFVPSCDQAGGYEQIQCHQGESLQVPLVSSLISFL